MKLYVGNLPWTATEDEVRDLFGQYGEVQSVAIILERDTGRSRGFCFVQLADAAAKAAIDGADGYLLGGRPLRVNEARQTDRGPRRGPLGPRR